MDVKMLVSDTEIIPRIKLEQFEFDILKMSKEKAEKIIDDIAQQCIYMHMKMMILKIKDDIDRKEEQNGTLKTDQEDL